MKYPKFVWGVRFLKRYRRVMKLKDPSTLYEKMVQGYLRSNHDILASLTDKYEVRQYIAEKIGSQYLNELYGVYESPLLIDFDKLPTSFVLKTTNGCATNIIVSNKEELSSSVAVSRLTKWLDTPYGELTGQLHYAKIKPRIVAERFLIQVPIGSPLIDYKFYCIHGRVEFMLVCMNRQSGTHVYDAIICNREGQFCPEFSNHRFGENFQYEAPYSFSEMLNLSEKLAEEFPFVRIDFYEIDRRPIFGEITFTPGLDYHPLSLEQEILRRWEQLEVANKQ